MSNKVKFFLDTEFIELGRNHPLELLSIGIVCENGNDLYLENINPNFNSANDWVKENVFPNLYSFKDRHLESSSHLFIQSINDIARNIERFIKINSIVGVGDIFKHSSGNTLQEGKQLKPEFWGYFADYDWIIFCQLFGTMMDLPKGFPYYCNDLKQLMKSFGFDESLDELTKQESNHNALDDAKQIKMGYDIVMNKWRTL